jgi:uncharacterized protein YbaP (TraB family)
MKKYFSKIVAFISVLYCLSFTYSDVSPFPFTKSSLLWKIEGPNTLNESYLFGTMHLIEKDFFIFPQKLEKIVSKTDLLIMELKGLPTPEESLDLITLKQGSFFDFFTKDEIDSVLNWAKSELKMNEQAFRSSFYKLKPFMIVQLATQLQFSGKTESYELTFQKIATKNKIEQIGLETFIEQMSLFDNLTKNEQAELVMESIRDSKKSVNIINKMQQIYFRQNVDSLLLLVQNESGILSTKQSDFVDNRNSNWIPQIKNKIANKKCFIAVGAGHLGGENGLIRRLQKEGFTLTPIEL